jgi:hypothetical protein
MSNELVNHTDLDIARAVVLSASRSDLSESPIKNHIHRLENLAKKFGFRGSFLETLGILSDLKEIQHLGGGYWVPAPSRNIRIEDEWLIISSVPTAHLPQDLNLLNSCGFARNAKNPNSEWPTQELSDWLGTTKDLRMWISEYLITASKYLGKTSLCFTELQFYGPWVKQKIYKRSFRNWIPLADMPESMKKILFLARAIDDGITKYYWCSFENNLLLESSIVVRSKEVIKIQYALEIFHESEWRELKMIYIDDNIFFDCKFQLPSEIDILLKALGEKIVKNDSTTYKIQKNHEKFISNQIKKFHIKFN